MFLADEIEALMRERRRMKGKITPETFEEWNRETGSAKLPERVNAKKEARSKRKTTLKRRAK